MVAEGWEGGAGQCLLGHCINRVFDFDGVKIESCQANQELPGVQQVFRAGPTFALTYLPGEASTRRQPRENCRRTMCAARCKSREVIQAELFVDALFRHESFESVAIDAAIAVLKDKCPA